MSRVKPLVAAILMAAALGATLGEPSVRAQPGPPAPSPGTRPAAAAATGAAATAVNPPANPGAPAPAARCTLKVLNALPGSGGIDPAVTVLRPYLQQPPFSSWKTFKLLSKTEQELKVGMSATYAGPQSQVVVRYTGHAVHEGKHRIKGGLHIEGARFTTRTSFTLDEGKFLLAAGEKYRGGILIYSLSCITSD